MNIAYAYSLTTCIVHVQQSCQCCCALQAKLDMFVAMQQLLQQSTGSAWSDFAGCSEKLVQIMLEHIGRYNKTCCLAPCVGFKRLRSLCTHHCIYSCLRLVGAHDCANHIALHMPQLSHCCIHHSKLSLSLTLDWKSQQTVWSFKLCQEDCSAGIFITAAKSRRFMHSWPLCKLAALGCHLRISHLL